MKRRIAIIVSLFVWVAACLLFFYWYLGLVEVELSLSLATVVALAGVWIFLTAYFFPNIIVRSLLITGLVVGLGWALVNFVYYNIFGVFLSIFSSRLLSLNLPMLRLAGEFVHTIPLPLAFAAAGLLTLFWAVCLVLRVPKYDELRAVFSSDPRAKRSVPLRTRFRKTSIIAGLAAQLGAFIIMTNMMTPPVPAQPNDNIALSSFASAKSNIETLRDSISKLEANAKTEYNPARPTPPKTPHVIFYQMETADAWALEQDPSPMPFLASLMKKYGTVDDYFANGCTTVDSEFAVSCGFLPETNGPVSDLYSKNSYDCLPSILKEKGYATYIYHANSSSFWSRADLAPAWGYDHLNFEPVFKYREPDGMIFDRVVEDIKKSDQPTLQYVIGMTGHAPHDEHFQNVLNNNFGLNIQPYAGELGASSQAMNMDEKTLRLYLGFLKATDDGLAHLFDRLTDEGLLDTTAVVIYGDHRYYRADSGDAAKDFLLYNRIPLAIALPGATATAWPKIASHIDIAPTIFDYLTSGTETLPPTFLGTSLFSPAHRDGAINKCLGRVSYFDGTERRGGDELMSIARQSDLLLARNLLGKNAAAEPVADKDSADINTDTDKDGLSDLRERALGTDKNKPDTDGDGFSDGVEVMNGFDPLGPGKKYWETPAP